MHQNGEETAAGVQKGEFSVKAKNTCTTATIKRITTTRHPDTARAAPQSVTRALTGLVSLSQQKRVALEFELRQLLVGPQTPPAPSPQASRHRCTVQRPRVAPVASPWQQEQQMLE
jgi:hypothetical protein